MTGRRSRIGPPSGTVPVVVPGDVVLASSAGLVVWAGAVTVYPEGFAFALLTLTDTRRAGQPASWALDVAERGRMTWLEIGYPDGRRRAADMNANTPRRQPGGPHVTVLDASVSDGCGDSRW
jgi:predicted P-loop ATPase